MAIVLRTDQTLRIVLPSDPAIDTEATPAEEWADYQDPTESKHLQLAEGLQFKGEPTWFTVRPLGYLDRLEAESTIQELVAEYGGKVEDIPGHKFRVAAVKKAEANVLLGLVSVEGLDIGEAPGGKWPRSMLNGFGPEDVAFLGNAVELLTQVPLGRSGISGS